MPRCSPFPWTTSPTCVIGPGGSQLAMGWHGASPPPAPAASTWPTPWPRPRRPAPSGSPTAAIAEGLAALALGQGPLRAGRRRPALHRARRLRPHSRWPRTGPAGRPRAGRRAGHRGLRLRRGPGPFEAAADGSGGQPPVGPRRAHLGQPAERGPRSDHRRGGSRRRRAPARCGSMPTGPGRSSIALGAAEAGDVVVIAGKGHETGQEVGGRVVPLRRRRGGAGGAGRSGRSDDAEDVRP